MTLNRSTNLLVVGNGDREHALCWKLAQSEFARQIYCAPGNGGTAGTPKVTNIDIAVMDFTAIIEFCQAKEIDLVVVGPDNPLAEGIVDHLQRNEIRVFGPRREAARLEWSKGFAKVFMDRFDIPTARYIRCFSHGEALQAVQDHDWARVVKVDGLALGKGVFVCDSEPEVIKALDTIFQEKVFGESGSQVVLEQRLTGEELSLLALCDGKTLLPLLPTRDHKRRFDGDRGPNTGGMGAYAPVILDQALLTAIDKQVLHPIRTALSSGMFFYTGILYIGLMLDESQRQADPASSDFLNPQVLEFNARFGDPETQTLLPLMKSDLLPLLWACTDITLDQHTIEWSEQSSCCVVAGAKSYPEGSSRGESIELGQPRADAVCFQAGTTILDGALVTNGGRILSVTGLGADMKEARHKAYETLKDIKFTDMDYRKDIAEKAVASCHSG